LCVIMIAEKQRPTSLMVADAYHQNPEGFGIAYRDGEGKEKVVRWKKGLFKLEEAQELCADTPLPYIAHFRVASVGGVKAGLCHPFPVEVDVPLREEGYTKGYVLFHNGHWANWDKSLLEATYRGQGKKIPAGRWSDSRAMAWMAAQYGLGILEFIGEKCIAFSPDSYEIVAGTGWSLVNDIWCSNNFFVQRWQRTTKDVTILDGEKSGHSTAGKTDEPKRGHVTTLRGYAAGMCRYGSCTAKKDLDASGFCPKHLRESRDGRRVVELRSQSGGTGAIVPFDQAVKMFREGKISKEMVSNNKWKQLRREMGKQVDQEFKTALKQEAAEAAAHRARIAKLAEELTSEVPPVLVKH